MKIATFNVNSIRSRLDIVLEWLVEYQPGILGVQETKVQDAAFPKEAFEAAGYHVVFRGEKSYNGVALISKNEPQEIRFGFDDGGPSDETRMVAATFGDIVVVNTYIPQGRAIDHILYKYKLRWYARLRAFLEKNYSVDQPLAWIGDMNIAVQPIDVTNPDGKKSDVCYHADCRMAFLQACEFGVEDLFRRFHPEGGHYSFFDYRVKDAVERGIGWRIDYILATPPLASRCSDCWIDVAPRLKPKPSDHTFMVAEFH